MQESSVWYIDRCAENPQGWSSNQYSYDQGFRNTRHDDSLPIFYGLLTVFALMTQELSCFADLSKPGVAKPGEIHCHCDTGSYNALRHLLDVELSRSSKVWPSRVHNIAISSATMSSHGVPYSHGENRITRVV